MKSQFWQTNVYRYIIVGCALFLALTIAAMFFYPGGNFNEDLTYGYDFFRNFFSDLGRIHVSGGRSNLTYAVLFWTGLTLAGSGLVLFFIAFRQLFRADRAGQLLSDLGSAIGVTSGLCFVGVAFTPYDLFFAAHYNLVFWAFRTFLVAVALYTAVIYRQKAYPRRNGWVFVFFTIMLAAYLLLLEVGPEAATPSGLIIQATGQKVIAYVSILSVMAQSWLVLRFRRANGV